ncbi:MAG: DNA replication complex GINS family protein [Aigarchaeota archaeon]|nr:DNA replication complex GINS family protein [Aigarchaeota archaeon]MCX8192866.1 DNA replication complex GINS family protein [Nitrososphaeria archaeon]MDW7986594.1 hypothetical protein [Nitrososphaerota archaeon]
MSIEAVVEEFKKLLKTIEVEYENSEKKVTLTRDIQRLVLPGQVFENLRKGTVLSVAKWAASRLHEAGVIEYGERTLDMKSLVQLEWKEKNNPGELQEVPRYFYLMIKEEEAKLDSTLRSIVVDIISLRMHKILGFAAKRVDVSLVENLSREEEALYKAVKNLIDAWLRYVTPTGGG